MGGVPTTIWQALFDWSNLSAGQTVLIHGATDGVGMFAVQLARWKGAHAIATASNSSIQTVRKLGADEAIDDKTKPFEQVVKETAQALELNKIEHTHGKIAIQVVVRAPVIAV